MKYIGISLALHGLVFGLLSFKFLHLSPPAPTQVVVELYIPPQGGGSPQEKSRPKSPLPSTPPPVAQATPTPKTPTRPSKKSQQPTSYDDEEPRIDTESQVAEKASGTSRQETTERFLKSQEGQKMLATYAEQLKVYLEQNKRYPRRALKLRHSGTVKVRLQITTDGQFGEIRVIAPSQFDTLNQAAVQLLKDLGRFKPLPNQWLEKEEFVIPIAYHLRGGAY